MLKVTWLHWLEYGAVRGFFTLLAALPEKFAYASAAWFGEFCFRISKRRQSYALKFLRNAYPDAVVGDAELLALGRRSTGNFVKVFMDMLRMPKMIKQGKFAARVDMSEVEAIPAAPYIGISPHLGSWEVGAVAFAAREGEAHGLARLAKNPLLQQFILRTRTGMGLRIHSRRGGFRQMVRALAEGKVALQLVDQNQRLRGVFVPFFGQPASTERAAASLALRCGYPLVVAYCLRQGKGFDFKVKVHEVIQPQAGSHSKADVIRLVAQINRSLEAAILQHPEQYLWVHDRYRCQPTAADLELAKQALAKQALEPVRAS